MAIKTNIALFNVFHEAKEKVVRCVYDKEHNMVVGFIDLPKETNGPEYEQYLKTVADTVQGHIEWAKTATEQDVVSVPNRLTGSIPTGV